MQWPRMDELPLTRRDLIKGSLAAAALMALPRGGFAQMAQETIRVPLILSCEYDARNPRGIGETVPRFSWKRTETAIGSRQTKYRVTVGTAAGKSDLWDSGEVESDQSVFLEYKGKPLASRQEVCWQVQTWDEAGRSITSGTGMFELGLVNEKEITAKWIQTDIVGDEKTSPAVPYLRKAFDLGNIASARLYVTALGLYETYINGQRVGTSHFRPGWTDYNQRIQLDTYDVTSLLKPGGNVIGTLLGDGWYCGFVGFRNKRNLYGDRPRFLAQLEVTTADGKVTTISSDESWTWSPSEILSSDLLDGENVDARKAIPDWSKAAAPAGEWKPVAVAPGTTAKIVCPKGPPCRVMQEIVPISDPKLDPTDAEKKRWIFDLGQNMVGVARLKVKGPAGTTVRLRFAEMLDTNGAMYVENLRDAKATDYYTLRGDASGETFEPKFTFHGFRYVELSGLAEPPTRESVTGVVIHSDMELTGSFECSDPLINQLQHCIQWGQRGNFLDVPTDCPQRNERLGWTGDAQVFAPTACFNFNSSGFYAKWQDDLLDAQGDKGEAPSFAPKFDFNPDGGPAWADAMIIVPWSAYRAFDDKRLLEEHYDSFKRYVEYLEKHNSVDLIRCPFGWEGFRGYGDWLSPDSGDPGRAATPRDLIGTAYFARCAYLLAEIAQQLGKKDDAKSLRHLHDRVKHAFVKEFLSPAGRLVGDTQTGVLLALAFDLVPKEHRKRVEAQLVHLVHDRGDHLCTGFVGTPLLLPTLSAIGQTELAYKVLKQEDYPGWLFTMKQGATTMWERWNSYTNDKGFGDAGMNSFNHYAYGAVGEWMYATIGGIAMDQPAYKRSIIAPKPGGGITFAKCSVQTPYGLLSTDWKDSEKSFDLEIVVPPNTSARVTLPVDAKSTFTVNGKDAGSSAGVSKVEGNGFEIAAGRYAIRAEK
jgi:alpha-L-rhamnosidase